MTGKGHLRPSYNGVRDLPTRLTKSDFIGFCREKTDQVSYQVIPETATQTTVVQCVLFFNEESINSVFYYIKHL